MSIAEFSAALKNKAIKEWFNTEASARESYRKANINTIINAASDYRAAEQTADKTSFVITKDTVADLLVDLKGMDRNDPVFQSVVDDTFRQFGSKNAGVKVNRRKITVGSDLPAVYFNSISFDGITNLVNAILQLKPKELAEKYEKGHVVGLNTELLRITAGRISAIDARSAAGAKDAKELILKELDKVIEYYKRLDFESANIQPAEDIAIYAALDKKISKTGKTKYLVELQTKDANQKSAGEVKDTIGSIRKLFTPGALSEKAMADVIDKLTKSVTDPKFAQDLADLRSSPSMKDMIVDHIANTISGKPTDQSYTVSKRVIATKPVPKPNLNNLRKVIKEEMAAASELRNKLNTTPKLNSPTTLNILSLQAILAGRINQHVADNMGTGDSRDILNLRTGRFADSVSVNRVTMSREGMISVYYSYMKYPYATFSQGGKQQYPRSRDPKLLISQSIREIASTIVTNRLRAVLE
ncbi:hypothetical protein UFOVP273_139 [uncultured Caudovirales phage]|uniref:Uncharacterized protein n=1 Tax=uncultured Caudovirales phage TaxID=2100421 RepID=A0A6J5LND1_9CAUD|nr:hypothetical protein UFOVP273_139 [uncultured Caudovirales phage]